MATIQDPLIFAPGAVSVANGYVYVGDCDGLATAVINTLTNTVVGTVDLANQCNSSMSLVGNELYAVSGDHVAVVDADPLSQSFEAVVHTIPLTTPPGGTTPRATTLVASGSSVYVADVDNFLFDVIDSGTRSVVATIPDPSGANDAQSMATAEGYVYVYVSYDYPGTVEVLDTHANTVAGVVGPLGDYQDNIAAEGQNAYASGSSDPSVTVIHVENPAAGPYVPLQAYGITADGTCGKDVPDSVNWPGIASQQSAGWSKSWQQWPNNGTGGFVCQRQAYYTTTGMSVG